MRKYILVSVIFLLTGCTPNDTEVYTLYRNSAFDQSSRIHVSTFDAKDGADYNKTNCDIAQSLFNSQKGIETKFFCERGRFKK